MYLVKPPSYGAKKRSLASYKTKHQKFDKTNCKKSTSATFLRQKLLEVPMCYTLGLPSGLRARAWGFCGVANNRKIHHWLWLITLALTHRLTTACWWVCQADRLFSRLSLFSLSPFFCSFFPLLPSTGFRSNIHRLKCKTIHRLYYSSSQRIVHPVSKTFWNRQFLLKMSTQNPISRRWQSRFSKYGTPSNEFCEGIYRYLFQHNDDAKRNNRCRFTYFESQ